FSLLLRDTRISSPSMPSNAASRKSCIHCGKIVKSAKDLKAHERLHLVDAVRSPFKCDPCGKMFTARGSLRIHHKIHLETEEERRPYKCKECEKGCTTRYVLEHHRRTHSQVHLPTLDSGFASDMEESDTSDWDEDTDGHSLTDDASRLFECADCGQKSTSSSTLERLLEELGIPLVHPSFVPLSTTLISVNCVERPMHMLETGRPTASLSSMIPARLEDPSAFPALVRSLLTTSLSRIIPAELADAVAATRVLRNVNNRTTMFLPF
ncbi:hypothetical protein PMAYCL1PPCAC_10936, partial [Pristionchus mayeri]